MSSNSDRRPVLAVNGPSPRSRLSQRSFLEHQVFRLFTELAHVHGLPNSVLPIVEDAVRLFAGAKSIPAARARWHRRLRTDTEPAAGQSLDRRYILSFALHAMSSPLRAMPGEGARTVHHSCVPAEIAIRVAALLRLASALAHPRGGGTSLVAVLDDGSTLGLVLRGGPAAARAVKLLRSRCDLWNAVMLRPISEIVEVRPGRPRALSLAELAVPQAAARILLRQLESVVSRTYGADYVEDPEFVHEMRLAVRKARIVCRVFQPVLKEAERELKPLLKPLARALSAARDSDVLYEFLNQWKRGTRESPPPLLEALLRHTEAHRQVLYGVVWRVAQDADMQTQLADTMARLRSCATETASCALEAGTEFRDTLTMAAPAIAVKSWHRALKFRRNLAALSPKKLHRLRIACKRLRYTAEFLQDVEAGDLKRIRNGAQKVQQHLGTVRDVEIHAETVGRFAAAARPLSTPDRAALEALQTALERRRRKALHRAGKAWQRLRELSCPWVPRHGSPTAFANGNKP